MIINITIYDFKFALLVILNAIFMHLTLRRNKFYHFRKMKNNCLSSMFQKAQLRESPLNDLKQNFKLEIVLFCGVLLNIV